MARTKFTPRKTHSRKLTPLEESQEKARQVIDAAGNGDLSAVVAWLDDGGDVDTAWVHFRSSIYGHEKSGRTMLMDASFFGHTIVVDKLLERGANVNQRGDVHYTALMLSLIHI